MTPIEFKEARQALGYTQTQMAAALELEGPQSRRSIRYWETGERPISGPVRVAVGFMQGGAMPKEKALKRALRAVRKARDDSDSFDHGGMASHEIMEVLVSALQSEFGAKAVEA